MGTVKIIRGAEYDSVEREGEDPVSKPAGEYQKFLLDEGYRLDESPAKNIEIWRKKCQTKAEFITWYVSQYNISLKALEKQGFNPTPCDCGLPVCNGWWSEYDPLRRR